MKNHIPLFLGLFLSLHTALPAAPQTPSPNAPDPFDAVLDGKAPLIVKEILPPPEDITFRRILFQTREKNGIYAVVAAPKKPGKHPGILLLHGSGGAAEEHKAMAWAQRGYVAVAPDLPGLYSPLTHGDLPMTRNYAEGRYSLQPDSRRSVIFDGVLAAMKALDLLRAHPDVDPERIGVCGVSWGGTMTTMVCSLAGDKVRAGFAIYGCGFFDLGNWRTNKPNPVFRPGSWAGNLTPEEREQWLRDFDPGRRAHNIKAAFFLASAANDFFGWPEAVQATLDVIPGDKNQVYAPNSNHSAKVPGGTEFGQARPVPGGPAFVGNRANWLAMEVPYFDYHLRDIGQPLPKVTVEPDENPYLVQFKVRSPHPLTKAEVYWAKAYPPEATTDPDKLREAQSKREWVGVPATKTGDGSYRAQLPPEAAAWFALVSDDRPVSVSSPLCAIPPGAR